MPLSCGSASRCHRRTVEVGGRSRADQPDALKCRISRDSVGFGRPNLLLDMVITRGNADVCSQHRARLTRAVSNSHSWNGQITAIEHFDPGH